MSEQKLYIGNLPYRATEGDVREHFSEYCPIYSVILIYDYETGKTRGYGFVELENAAAEAALRELNDTMFMGRNMKIRRANDYTASPQRRYLAPTPSKTVANGSGYGTPAARGIKNSHFAEYGDFKQDDFKGLFVNGKYYEIERDKYGLYHAYKFTDSKMKYSGPSNAA